MASDKQIEENFFEFSSSTDQTFHRICCNSMPENYLFIDSSLHSSTIFHHENDYQAKNLHELQAMAFQAFNETRASRARSNGLESEKLSPDVTKTKELSRDTTKLEVLCPENAKMEDLRAMRASSNIKGIEENWDTRYKSICFFRPKPRSFKFSGEDSGGGSKISFEDFGPNYGNLKTSNQDSNQKPGRLKISGDDRGKKGKEFMFSGKKMYSFTIPGDYSGHDAGNFEFSGEQSDTKSDAATLGDWNSKDENGIIGNEEESSVENEMGIIEFGENISGEENDNERGVIGFDEDIFRKEGVKEKMRVLGEMVGMNIEKPGELIGEVVRFSFVAGC
ncbi:hypothetical protein AMTR_s00109p00137470 [Amborella trichopoda]|uniref:Uncharacterized protein n=1 Tax=Amborella trichopoda TaxID=13333 RepID=W1NS35_AMBTC|nr:hypothetical protein AMTR_s00109p00137470 [Amborella trichopoda]